MKKAVVYARYSSDNQTEQSIEGQLRVCTEYAEKHHLEIVETYIDRAMTGTNDNRPDFKKMLAESSKKRWDCVLVYKFDRFSRNKYESVIHKKHLKDLGISVISAMENIPDTPEGIILESLLEGLNQYYSAELSQKVKRGLRESRLKGLFQGGKRPYGYDVVNTKLVINEEEANVVRYIFKEYSLGTIGTIIARRLNKRNIKYKTQIFDKSIIYKILHKEYYTGLYRYGNEFYYDVYPPIISRNIFKKVQTLRQAYRYGGAARNLYHYKNKLFCKKCGNHYHSDAGTSQHSTTKYRYYKCCKKRVYHDCDSITYPKEFLEDYLTSLLTEFISDNENLETIWKNLMKKYKEKKNINLIKSCETEIQKCQASLNNLCKAVEKGVFTNTTNDRIQVLETRINELQAEIAIEKSKDSTRHSFSFIKKFYTKALELDSINFSYYLVNRILLDNDTFDIYLEVPYEDKFKEYELIKSFNYKKIYESKLRRMDFDKKINIYI